MSAKKAAKKAKLVVQFGADKGGEKQWNKPQAAAKEMLLAIGKLSKLADADDIKLGKIRVEFTLDLGAKEMVLNGLVQED